MRVAAIVTSKVIAEFDAHAGVIAHPDMHAAAEVDGGECAFPIADTHPRISTRDECRAETQDGVCGSDDQAIEETKFAAGANAIADNYLAAAGGVECGVGIDES